MRVHFVTGDITDYPEVDVVVNAANAQLLRGGGVCGAIFRAAGSDALTESCQAITPNAAGERCPTGESRVTPAHGLPNKAIIHSVGPIYAAQDPTQSARLLYRTYQSALQRAVEAGFTSIAFPAISCGIYGYPLEEAARVAITTMVVNSAAYPTIKEVHFVFLPFADGPEVKAVFESVAVLIKDETVLENTANIHLPQS